MLVVRLPDELEQEMNRIASAKHRTHSEVIREALTRYVESYRTERPAYELGKDLFGSYGSGDIGRSSHYKGELKKRLRAKHGH
jgi:Arc/MetJ-type ribon-helix-helix transcriptional regulator